MTAKLHPIKHIILKALLISIGVYKDIITILSAKIDSGGMFCLQHDQELMIDKPLVYESYPQDRINTQVNYQIALDQVECTC